MSHDLYLPSLSHWLHRNQWTGSLGTAQYHILPRKDEDTMDASVWVGPLNRQLSEISISANFPITDVGIQELGQWLTQQSALINNR